MVGCGAAGPAGREGLPPSQTGSCRGSLSGVELRAAPPREPGAGSRGAEGGGRAEAGEVPTRSVSAGATPLHQLVL